MAQPPLGDFFRSSEDMIMQVSQVSTPRFSRAQYEAIRACENASCAALAAKWGVAAVGRDYPLHLNRAGLAVAGEWYVIRKGLRCNASAAQSSELDRIGNYGVHAIGPIYVTGVPAETETAHSRAE